MTITTRLRSLGLAAALLGAGLSGQAFAAQGSELNNEPTAFAAARGPAAGPLAAARPATDLRAARAISAQNYLERSGATGGGGQHG